MDANTVLAAVEETAAAAENAAAGFSVGISDAPFFGGVFGRVFADGLMTPSRMLLISLIGFVVVFIVLGIIALFVKGLGRTFDTLNSKKKAPAVTVPPAAVPGPAAAPEKKFEGVKLTDVSDADAAVIMAIVSDRSGIPLDRLQFNYIRPAEDK